jgi:hypothetical protein
MTTRRNLLKGGAAAATGVVFCSCGLLDRAHAQGQSSRTLPVAVNGKKVRTIDVHAHCYFHDVEALVGPEIAKRFLPPVNYAANAFIEIQKGSTRWTRRPSTWKSSRSIPTGTASTAISPARS